MNNSNWLIDIKQKLSTLDGTVYHYSGYTSPIGYEKYVFLNTISFEDLDANTDVAFTEDVYGHIVHLHVDPQCGIAFNIILNISCDIPGEEEPKRESLTYSYTPDMISEASMKNGSSPNFLGEEVSYMLLRANPKLTGNVKVVVDSDSNMYLDTFKISLGLAQYKYRHIALNPNDYYGQTLMTKFHDMPVDDLYKIEDGCYNLFTTVDSYDKQYYNTYNYGVRTNNDNLYHENFALLAPLCIKPEVMPDFFVVFKVNTDEYNKKIKSKELVTDNDKFKYFVSSGSIVKTYDMRKDSPIGKYIRTISSFAEKVPGDAYAAYNERSFNKFIGISVDRGVVTSAYEPVYNESNINNQVALNNYFTLGFERNKLVSRNIINFEFMFDDTEEKLFSIHTYFGLYVKMNGEVDTFSCIGSHIESLTDEYNNVYDTSIYEFDKNIASFPINTNLDTLYPEIIYGISTPNELFRIKTGLYDNPINEKFIKKPYESILHGTLRKMAKDSRPSEFITINAKRKFHAGEYLRFIDFENATILEVVFSNYKKYMYEDYTSDIKYNYILHDGIRYMMKTVSVYTDDDIDSETQMSAIFRALHKLSDKTSIVPRKYTENAISVNSVSHNTVFEYVSEFSDYDIDQKESLLSNHEDDDTVCVFGDEKMEKIILDLSVENFFDTDNFYLYPEYARATGNRIVYASKFLSMDSFDYMIETDNIENLNKYTTLYRKNSSEFELCKDIQILILTESSEIIRNKKYVQSPYLGNTYIVNMPELDREYANLLVGNTISIYNAYPINVGVCSVLQIKDFDFDVLDNTTKITYSSPDKERTVGTNAGEFKSQNYTGVEICKDPEENFTDYIETGRKYFRDYLIAKDDSGGEGNIRLYYNSLDSSVIRNKYYKVLLKDAVKSSEISLLSPYLCKWQANGTDSRGQALRLMYNYSIKNMINTKSYFIPYTMSEDDLQNEINFNSSIGYMNYNAEYDKYISHSLDAIIKPYNSDTGISAMDGILNGYMSLDDMLYDKKSMGRKYSRVYISGENGIEFISGGLKIRIRSNNDNIINFNTYNEFSASLISIPKSDSLHGNSISLIIDEDNKRLLLAWYHGVDSFETGENEVNRIFHKAPLSDIYCKTINSENDERVSVLSTAYDISTIDPSLGLGKGYLIQETDNFYEQTSFSKMPRLSIISTLPETYDELVDEGLGRINTYNPIIWNDSSQIVANNNEIWSNIDFYNAGEVMYLITDNANAKSSIKGFTEFLNEINSVNIYVKRDNEKLDYTTISDLITLSVVQPYSIKKVYDKELDIENHGYESVGMVHSMYMEPKMKNILSFDFSNSELNTILEKNLNASNILVSGISKLSQIWINKYTETIDYCIPNNETDLYTYHGTDTPVEKYHKLSLDVINNMDIMLGAWDNNIYRNYKYQYITGSADHSIDNIEWYEPVNGYETGFEPNMFINSRGINLNGIDGSTIILDNWSSTKIDLHNGFIRLNISETLIRYIMFSEGFLDSWDYLSLRNNTYKIRYIKNTVLKYININNKVKFEVYDIPGTYSMFFMDTLDEDENLEKVDNIKHELKYENGKYYMYIYPDEPHIYYAKMTIKIK